MIFRVNDERYKTYMKIVRPNQNPEKAAKYFEDPLGFYFHKKGDFLHPKIKFEEPYKRTDAYQTCLKKSNIHLPKNP